jgi:hypothetical protein
MDFGSTAGGSVKDEGGGDFRLEHFLKAKRLGADLNFVGAMGFGFAAFVFDRCDGRRRPKIAATFHDVADAGNAILFRGNMKMPQDGAAGAVFVGAFVGFLVKELPLCREAILRPDLLVVDQRALPRAVEPVLERGEGDQFHTFWFWDIDCMHFLMSSACMTQVTVRNIEDDWVEKAKAEARARNLSMNSVLKEAIARGLGVESVKASNGLDRFAGCMPFEADEERKQWDEHMADCGRIETEEWK